MRDQLVTHLVASSSTGHRGEIFSAILAASVSLISAPR
jgi:hypothetical protein